MTVGASNRLFEVAQYDDLQMEAYAYGPAHIGAVQLLLDAGALVTHRMDASLPYLGNSPAIVTIAVQLQYFRFRFGEGRVGWFSLHGSGVRYTNYT